MCCAHAQHIIRSQQAPTQRARNEHGWCGRTGRLHERTLTHKHTLRTLSELRGGTHNTEHNNTKEKTHNRLAGWFLDVVLRYSTLQTSEHTEQCSLCHPSTPSHCPVQCNRCNWLPKNLSLNHISNQTPSPPPFHPNAHGTFSSCSPHTNTD